MSFSANGENLKLGRGALFLAPWSSGTAPGAADFGKFVGNVTTLELTSTNETREKYSASEQSSPLIDRRVIRQAYELVAACDEHTMDNIKLFMSGDRTTVSQSSGTAATFALDNVIVGNTYYIGARNVTSVVVKEGATTLTAGTDYSVDAALGLVTILGGGVADLDDLEVTFNKPAATIQKVRGGTTVSPTYKLVYQSDDANTDGNAAQDRLTVWKVSVAADGGYSFVGDDYSSFSLRFSVLSDSANHASEPFFVLERV
jgi:hypothetical protein